MAAISDQGDSASGPQQDEQGFTPPPPRLRVLIVGGGVSGLALAAALAQRNVATVTVIEKLPSWKASLGYVLGLWPMACNALQSVGALEEIMPVTRFCRSGHAPL